MPTLGSKCLLPPAKHSSGSSNHSAIVSGASSFRGAIRPPRRPSLIEILHLFQRLPVDLAPRRGHFQVGKREEVLFIDLVLKRPVVSRYARPAHVHRQHPGLDDRRLLTEVQEEPRLPPGEILSPEVDFAQVEVVVHPRLQAGDPAADSHRWQRGLAVCRQVSLGPDAQAPLAFGELVELEPNRYVPPEVAPFPRALTLRPPRYLARGASATQGLVLYRPLSSVLPGREVEAAVQSIVPDAELSGVLE